MSWSLQVNCPHQENYIKVENLHLSARMLNILAIRERVSSQIFYLANKNCELNASVECRQ